MEFPLRVDTQTLKGARGLEPTSVGRNTVDVHDKKPLRTLVWAGQHSIVWVQGSDVFYRKDAMTAGPDIPITTTGEDGIIFNGIPDWVYEGKLQPAPPPSSRV